MKYKGLQHRLFQSEDLQFRAVEGDNGEKIIEGYALTYGTRSKLLYNSFYEVIEAGAFDEVLRDENLDVIFNFNHDNSKVMARTTNGTLTLTSDSKGLFFRAVLPEVSYANDLYTLIKRGDIFSNSFAFMPAKDGYRMTQEGEYELVTITKVEMLRDVSSVTFPAYPDTELSARGEIDLNKEPIVEERQEENEQIEDKTHDIYKKEFKFLKLN